MPVPTYEDLMLPVLEAISDGQPCTAKDLRDRVARAIEITPEDRAERIKSGACVFDNRVHWAVTYMVQAGLVERPRRGVVQVTARGQEVLKRGPRRIDNDLLAQFEEFIEFKHRARESDSDQRATPRRDSPITPDATPKETLSAAVDEANAAVATELLSRVRDQDPLFLEELVLSLLTAMGYGGREGAAERLGQSGDQGLDGVIRQDALGLDRVYVQAKRYSTDRPVSRPDIQAFVGALHGAQADRGVFITTSRFTSDASDYAERVPARLVLIDGTRLARLMIAHNIGVQDEEVFTLKRLDEDFFDVPS